jgi:uncharacterized repeat protein (TIGR02543 family)
MKSSSESNSFNFHLKSTFYIVLFGLLIVTACEFEDPIPTYTLNTNISPSEGGKISISPQLPNYKAGEVVTLTPEPNEHWVFKQWDGDATGNTTPLQISMNSNKSITGVFVKREYPLNIKIEGQGTVEEKIIANPSGRDYPHGTRVELKPIPKEGWVFESWGGDLSGNETPQIIAVDKEKNVLVKFKRRDYPLNLTITGEGTVEEKIISSPGGRSYPFETVVELKPVPKLGWVFESWGGDLTGNEAPKNITVDKEKNVTVKFKRRDYPLNITISGEGTIDEKIISNPGGRTYPFQTIVELTPKPKDGWVFESWEGDLTGNEAPKNITVDKEKNVTAKFKRRDYPLNLNIEGEGLVEEKIVSNPGGRTYPFQTVVELTPKPKDGWIFESWAGDLTGNEASKTITIDKEKNVTVKFKRKDYPLNITITGTGTVEEKIISTPGNRMYPYETIVELTPNPAIGWEFESWGGDLTGNESPIKVVVDKEKNILAMFKELTIVPAINTDLFPQINWNDHAQGKNTTYDINKDGVPDIISYEPTTNINTNPALIKILDYTGKSILNFNIKNSKPNIRDSLGNVIIDYADLNGDGFLDMGLSYYGEWWKGNPGEPGSTVDYIGNNIFLLLSKNSFNFDVIEILNAPNEPLQFNLNIADWDSDGLLDVLYSNYQEGKYLKNLGNNRFEKRTLTPKFNQGIFNKVDFNKDGKLDYINLFIKQTDENGNLQPGNEKSQVLSAVTSTGILTFDVVGKTLEKHVYPLRGVTSSERINLIDGDMDGDMDLIIGSFKISSTGRVTYIQEYFENTGTQFVFRNNFIEVDESLHGETQVWAKDLDGDGDEDLFYPTYRKSQLNAPNGSYFWWENTRNGFKINKKFKLIY